MTFSSLIAGTVPHHNKFSNRNGQPIVRVLQHHHAASSLAGLTRLTDPNQQASANYVILSTGQIFGQVPEEYRAWTSGSFEADAPSITYEVQNSGGQVNGNDDDPKSWTITPAAEAAIVRLTADIAKRYRWGGVAAGNYRGHREFYQTACPGGYIWNRMSLIRANANAMAVGKVPSGTPAPAHPPVAAKSIWTLAQETIKGIYGSGDARKKALGSKYDAVQAEVNRILGAPKAALPKVKSIAQLADETIAGVYGSGAVRQQKLGANYAAVQAEVNRRLGAARPTGPSISQLADAVIRGEYGEGDMRKARLGGLYAAVQAEVNRRYGA
ncbi:endolysin [Arthrobacter phage Lewando]|nr:endolysin [Arthrobacter phage Lewando]